MVGYKKGWCNFAPVLHVSQSHLLCHHLISDLSSCLLASRLSKLKGSIRWIIFSMKATQLLGLGLDGDKVDVDDLIPIYTYKLIQ